jgi:serine phosphatase RsbU (regulator of sigma subunit)
LPEVGGLQMAARYLVGADGNQVGGDWYDVLGPDRSVPGPTEAELTCPAGSLLLLHTDGLTDIAGEDADERADLLERTLARLPADSDAERVVERLLGAARLDRLRDDVALLAIRLGG